MRLTCGCAFVLSAVLHTTASWAQTEIPITNPSFESPSLPDGQQSTSQIPGWTAPELFFPPVAVNPTSSQFSDVPDGQNVLWVRGSSSPLEQQLGTTYVAGRRYVLTCLTGQPLNVISNNAVFVELVADIPGQGLTVISRRAGPGQLTPGEFQSSASLATIAAGHPAVGRPIVVRLTGSDAWADSVRLTWAPSGDDLRVPEEIANPGQAARVAEPGSLVSVASGTYTVAGFVSAEGTVTLAGRGDPGETVLRRDPNLSGNLNGVAMSDLTLVGFDRINLTAEAGETVTIQNCVFDSCRWDPEIYGTLEFVDCVFLAADMYAIGMRAGPTGELRIQRSHFEGGVRPPSGITATGGAAITNLTNSLVVEDSVFARNIATNGGAIESGRGGSFSGPVTIRRSLFLGNGSAAATASGGALFVRGAPTVDIDNCVFIGNTANFGGAVFAESSSVSIRQTEMTGNTATAGAALYVGEAGDVDLVQSTLAFNSAPFGSGVLQDRFSMLNVENSVIAGGATAYLADPLSIAQASYSLINGDLGGTGVVDTDPALIAPPSGGGDGFGDDPSTPDTDEGANDDFGDASPMPGSPLIDAGSNPLVPTGLTDDLGGSTRFVDDPGTADTGVGPAPVVDIGAREFQGASPSCLADYDGNSTVEIFDILAFLVDWNAGNPTADLDDDGMFTIFDVIDFLGLWNTGCP